ncbi:hypothetical protein FSP39_015823 [Pinctada imbricata]|uniref:Glucose-methanol-choline oxidoreductase N-terminal domain-containing protein n=1 Tax=Pinctada imbricata TaxID=66713 RepID=A0AA89C7S1_PINIB|nr:hypothetical protein FSP39_015823 [Pinctada imbricata]
MAYVRGSRHDYDQWATEGCDGWSYKDVLPYFIKSEDNRVPWLQDSIYHGKEGPLTVSPGHVTGLDTYNSQAMQELGYPTVDCNGENQIGYEPMTLTTRDGVRCSTSLAYLRPASNRENLHVSPNSLGYKSKKVNIVNKVATGVQFIREGRKHFVHARREVILSAGAINSPQILLLSGIGPKKHLQSLNIPVEEDLPVGQNLQDHLLVPLMFFPNESMSIVPEKAMSIWNILLYKTMGKGKRIPLFYISKPTLTQIYQNMTMKYYIMEKLFLKTYRKNTNVFTVGPTLLQPASTGTITLKSRDPFDPPIIEPNYLSNKDDIHTLRKGIRKSLELGSTQTFKRLGIKLEDTYLALPDCKEYRVPSDEYLDCYIQHLAFTIGHPCCTCKMGGSNDVSAVVDSKLR